MTERTGGRQFPAIVFVLHDELYAFEQFGTATLLPWLQRYAQPSLVPSLPEWCLGVLNVRGTVQLVVDLGCLAGFGRSEIGDQARLIFLEHGTTQLGLVVDREIGMRTLRYADVPAHGEIPFVSSGAQLGDGPVFVLDGSAILLHVSGVLHAPVAGA